MKFKRGSNLQVINEVMKSTDRHRPHVRPRFLRLSKASRQPMNFKVGAQRTPKPLIQLFALRSGLR